MRKLGLLVALCLVSTVAFADDHTATGFTNGGLKYLAYFFGVAIASFGGTRAQSRAASVALEGIARNPSAADKLFVPMILGLALMESLVIFTLITIFLV